MFKKLYLTNAILIALGVSANANAKNDASIEKIVVTGSLAQDQLNRISETSSRLGLTIRETPAVVEIMTQDDMQLQGIRTQREAFDSVVGAISGNNPGNPAVVTMRGFGNAAISIMHDGTRISSSTMVTRDTNTWHFEKIEVIKGPSSVLFGEGALAGIINKVTRKPDFDGNHAEALLSFGSFGTLTTAAGGNLQVSDNVALRFDVSNLRSDSLYDVDANHVRSSGVTGSLLYSPSQELSVLVAVEHFDDSYDGTYQGMPMISREVAHDPSNALRSENGMVLDESIRHNNYNLDGNYSGTRDTTLRSRIDYDIGNGWSLANDFSIYEAERDYVYIGAQNYTAPTTEFPEGSLARSANYIIHYHDYWGNRLVFSHDGKVGDQRNRFSIGVEYNQSDFNNPRKFSPVGGTSDTPIPNVDIFNPISSPYPPESVFTYNAVYDSKVDTSSLFLENAFNISPQWLLVAGLRYDHLELKRDATDLLNNTFESSGKVDYDPVSWRLGTTYDINPEVAIYAQYTTAFVPVSTILIQSVENTGFKMTSGDSQEVGFKAALFNSRLELTGAAYQITQDDILTRDPEDFMRSIQGGTQRSRGAELAFKSHLTDTLSLDGGISYTHAEYDNLIEASGIDRSGNSPINTPDTTVDLGLTYRAAGLPLTLSSKIRHVSGFYTDTANTYFVRGRTTLDAAASYQLSESMKLSIRGRNLTDEFYGEYSGYPITSVYIGAPRSFEMALKMDF